MKTEEKKYKPLDEIPGFLDWLRANHKRTLADLAAEGQRLFTPYVTPSRLQYMRQKYRLLRREQKSLPLSREEKDFIIFNYDATPPGVMARRMEAAFHKEIAVNRVKDYYMFCGIKPEEYGGKTRNPSLYEE